jgi:hypothetical protein
MGGFHRVTMRARMPARPGTLVTFLDQRSRLRDHPRRAQRRHATGKPAPDS